MLSFGALKTLFFATLSRSQQPEHRLIQYSLGIPRHIILTTSLFLLCNPQTSFAKQISFQMVPNQEKTTFHYQWDTASKEELQVSFSLSNELLHKEEQYPIIVPMKQVLQVQRDAVNSWANKQAGVSIQAHLGANNTISIEVSGSDQALMSRKYQEALQIREQAEQQFLAANGYQLIQSELLPNFEFLIQEYAKALAPIANKLQQPGDNLDAYAKRALSFVQNIPYDHSQKNLFRRPISILKNNKGDCDSKTVLYLALIKAAYPNVPVAVVDITDHAFVLIGSRELDSKMEVEINGQIWVPIEPVGPGLSVIGELRPESLQDFQSGNFRLFIAE